MALDEPAGLNAPIRKYFAGSSWQRCRVHYARNLLVAIPGSHTEFDAAFRSIFALADRTEIEACWDEVAATLTGQFTEAAESMAGARTDELAFATIARSTGARSGPTTPSSGSTRR